MSLNCNEINQVLSELDLADTFIQEIVQPGYDTLTFRVIKHGSLRTILICTCAGACRINETWGKIPKNPKPLRFNEFLKSHVQGMRINSCVQIGLDRVIKMDVSTWQQKYFIYIRLWSGAANVIVTDESGNILDCMYRRPKKGEVSGGTFIMEEKEPSPDEKSAALQRFPLRTFDELKDAIEQNGGMLNGRKVLGQDGDFDSLSFNKKVDLFYSEYSSSLSRDKLLSQAEKWFNSKKSRMEQALEKLLQKQNDFAGAEKLKHTGDLILAYAQEANGSSLDCTDYDSGQQVHIRLDPKLSPQQNAQVYYSQYKKAVSGQEALAHDIELSRKNLAKLDSEYKALLEEKSVIKIEQMLRRDTAPAQTKEKPHPGLHYEIDGWTIIVGRTASENDDLLRHYVKGADMWLHTRDYAGGYVFIKAQKNKTVPLETLLYAGNLAVYHSKARKNAEADLYYTQVKYLRRAKNGPKGLVIPTQEKNLHIKLDAQKLRELEERG